MVEFVDFKPDRAYDGGVEPFALFVRGPEYVVAQARLYFLCNMVSRAMVAVPTCSLPGAFTRMLLS